MKILIIKGRPFSLNASPRSKNRWKRKIVTIAKSVFSSPSFHKDLRLEVTYYYDKPCGIDADNILKPICDALKGTAYRDDSQIADAHAHIRNIDGPYRIKGVSKEIVNAIVKGKEFVCIKVMRIRSEMEKI
ncbi:MAG: RusA family crossover junction endodeoxyribonuclease [Candidatus Omnitrophota bacterium]